MMYVANISPSRSIHTIDNGCQLERTPRSDTDRNIAALMHRERTHGDAPRAALEFQLLMWLDELDTARAGVPHSIVEIETEQAVARLAAALLGDGGAS